MTAAKKFLFDISFDHVEAREEAEAAPPPPPPEPTFSQAELDAVRAAALAEGRAAGLAEAAAAIATRTAAALEGILRGLATMFVARDAIIKECETQSLTAFRAVIGKALPALAAKGPLAEIEAVAAKCLRDAIDEPRIVLRVANEMYEPVREQLEPLIASSGYPGRVVLLADEGLSGGDTRVEWADGGVDRRLAEQMDEIEAAINRIYQPAAPAENASA
jgi:flagellar assembly protein FliH